MNNINFANPIILIIGAILIVMTIISFCIVIRKENRNFHNVFSFICHILMCVVVSLAFAKTTYETVVTETNIYIVADVSYSSNKNLDLVDEYINNVKEDAPKNSKIGVICFGKDYQLLVRLGQEIVSVKEANVDDSATNIANALSYAGNLFKNDVIKRIVLISDGKETVKSDVVNIVKGLSEKDIYVDAIYLDNNLNDDDFEVQISQVDYNQSAYKDINESAYALIESTKEAKGYIKLYVEGDAYNEKTLVVERTLVLNKGINSISVPLDTSTVGDHHYELVIDVPGDESDKNNTYLFNQYIPENLKVLFISGDENDREVATELYGENAEIDFYINNDAVPYMIEELAVYDEFVLSNIDISTLQECPTFINSIDTLVAEFGKSLITFGNTYIQTNYEDESLMKLNDMLPVKYGNGENDEKLVTLVLDISRSMELNYKLIMAKQAACTILDNLEDNVMVMLIAFYGDVGTVFTPTLASDRENLKQKVNSLGAYQGTFMGAALDYAYKFITSSPYSKNEVLLISDGLPYGEQEDFARAVVQKMSLANILLSVIHTDLKLSNEQFMRELASLGKGNYYPLDNEKKVESFILSEVLNSLTELVLEANESTVSIALSKDELVKGIDSLPNIKGLYNNQSKTSAKVVLNALYTDNREFTYEIPLYAYWNYGNGKVSTYASTLSGDWAEHWLNNESSKTVLSNIDDVNRPEVRTESAFTVEHQSNSVSTDIIITAPNNYYNLELILRVTSPKDNKAKEKKLIFDGNKYYATIDTKEVGEYKLSIEYKFGNTTGVSNYTFNVSYLPEYNSFTKFDASNLYYMVSSNGQISEDGHLDLSNNNSIVQKYIIDFTPILMIICICLFMIDIIVRKLKWQDIKTLFGLSKKKNYQNVKGVE